MPYRAPSVQKLCLFERNMRKASLLSLPKFPSGRDGNFTACGRAALAKSRGLWYADKNEERKACDAIFQFIEKS